jgi:sensor histidine kinase YesM
VENAIYHGVARRADAGRIEIIANVTGETLALAVIDDGAGVPERGEAAGVGLSNTRERLQTLHGGEAQLLLEGAVGGGTVVRITMPFRTVR